MSRFAPRPSRLTPVALLIALGTASARPHAQAEPAAAPAASEALAMAHKARGAYAQAGQTFEALVAAAAGGRREAALAEFHAVMAFHMARQAGRWDGLRRVTDAVRSGPFGQRHPTLADRLAGLALECDLATGNLEGTATRSAARRFLDAWWVIGPFDNERGAGFARPYPPETALDLGASYDGKKRTIRWTQLPVPSPPAGRIDLDAILRPNDQVLCYCATALVCDRNRQVLLHLGSDEAFKVFLNGQLIAGRDVSRRFAPDQDVVPLALRAGPNLLLLKICDQEGSWQFAARLTDLACRPVDGVEATSAVEAVRAASQTTPAATTPETPFLGARSLLADSVAQTGDPRDALRLAYILATTHSDDASDRRDHRLAQRAVAGLPEDASARYLLAFTRLRPGASAAEKDDNARRHDYGEILRCHPDHVQALTALARLELTGVGAAARAEHLLRHALTVNPDCAAARLDLARVLRAQRLEPLADREIETAASAAHPTPAVLAEFGKLLVRRGDLQGAIGQLRRALAVEHDSAVAAELVDLLLRTGQRDDAAQWLAQAEQLAPFAPKPRLRIARLREAEGDLEGAIEAVRRWLRICPEDDAALVDFARLQGLAGDVERQRATLRAALDLNPNRKTERRHLEFLEADHQPFYADFELDSSAVLEADPGAPANAAAQNDPYHYLLDQRVVRAYRNGTISEYRHRLLRVLNDEGARRLASWGVQHYWGEQRARLLDVRVIKPSGQVHRPRLRGAYVRMPPLAAGDIIEVRERVDDLGPSFFGDYFGLQHSLVPADGVPCQRAQLSVILEQGRDYRTQETGGAPPATRHIDARGDTVCVWELHDLPRTVVEERRPSRSESDPLVRITTYRDWNALSAWWWNLIRRQIEVSPAMRAKVAELTADLTTEAQKIAAIYRFVTTNIRYTAWEFGVHGYKPYGTKVIFERRHGDCKDKALLLGALLGEAGIDAYPVLINANPRRSADDLTLAMVQHFNHCISYLPPTAERAGMFLDGTATYHPIDTLPDMDQGAAVLVVKQGTAELQRITWVAADRNVMQREWHVTLTEAGDATVSLSERPSLNLAVGTREALGNEPAKRREQLERRLARAFGKVAVGEVRCGDLLDLSHPVEIEVDFVAPGFAARRDNGLVLRGALETRDLAPLVRAPTRELALLLGIPESEHSVLTYRLPTGFEPIELPPPTEITTRFGTFKMVWSFDAGTLRIERSRSLTTNRIEPAEYLEFREFAAAIGQADRQRVVVEKAHREER